MADSGVLVTISGAALSLLLYENVRSKGEQIGLLLGNVLTFITKNVTDCDRQVEHVKHHINIDTVLVCSKDILKNSLATIDTQKLETLVKNKEKHVIGWFQFRRHDFLVPTMKDKLMHKELASHFLKYTGASEEHFIMIRLGISTSSHFNGTHKYRHVCVQYNQGKFESVPLRINNLGDDAARHDGSDYKPVPRKKSVESDVFTKIIDELRLNLTFNSSVDVVKAIQKRAEKYLQEIITSVCESDEEISKLQQQVNELRASLQKIDSAKYIRQKEKTAEVYCAENEKIITTAQIHGSPRSIHSDDIFDADQPPNLSSNSPISNSHSFTRNVSMGQRGRQSLMSKEARNFSIQDSNFCEIIRSESSPETTRSKEGTPKFTSKGSKEEKLTMSKRQTNSPKNLGKKTDRHSYGDFSGHSQDETSSLGRKEQNPRPTSYTENR